MIQFGRLVKSVDRRRLLARAVFHIVHRHAVDVDRLGQRRPEAHALKRNPVAGAGSLLQRAAVVAEAFDQPADQVMRPGVRDVLHESRHVNDGIAVQHAEFEIIEKQNLHLLLLESRPGYYEYVTVCSTKIGEIRQVQTAHTQRRFGGVAGSRTRWKQCRQQSTSDPAHRPAIQAREIFAEQHHAHRHRAAHAVLAVFGGRIALEKYPAARCRDLLRPR